MKVKDFLNNFCTFYKPYIYVYTETFSEGKEFNYSNSKNIREQCIAEYGEREITHNGVSVGVDEEGYDFMNIKIK